MRTHTVHTAIEKLELVVSSFKHCAEAASGSDAKKFRALQNFASDTICDIKHAYSNEWLYPIVDNMTFPMSLFQDLPNDSPIGETLRTRTNALLDEMSDVERALFAHEFISLAAKEYFSHVQWPVVSEIVRAKMHESSEYEVRTLPCPYCFSNKIAVTDEGKGNYSVHCSRCGTTAPPSNETFPTMCQAVHHWNTHRSDIVPYRQEPTLTHLQKDLLCKRFDVPYFILAGWTPGEIDIVGRYSISPENAAYPSILSPYAFIESPLEIESLPHHLLRYYTRVRKECIQFVPENMADVFDSFINGSPSSVVPGCTNLLYDDLTRIGRIVHSALLYLKTKNEVQK